jgi:ABC-type dipeptide/oligopeptide/nickel transport system permease subunit
MTSPGVTGETGVTGGEEAGAAIDELAAEPLDLSEKPESLGRQAWNRFRHHRLAVVGVALLILLMLAFWIGPLLSPFAVDETNVLDKDLGPTFEHPFGTDPLGRDYFVRAMTGGQTSIGIAVLTAVVATAVGLVIGASAGYFGGWVDTIISFVVNSMLTIPLILILILFSQEVGSNMTMVAIVIALLSWLRVSRLVRAQVLQFKEMDYVMAARAAGAGPFHIISRHLFPNIIGTLLVEVTLLVGTAIILESTLSFLGLGVQAPLTTLGKIVSDNAGAIDSRPSRVLIPGAIITMIILSINFIGDALRDALDPKAGTE